MLVCESYYKPTSFPLCLWLSNLTYSGMGLQDVKNVQLRTYISLHYSIIEYGFPKDVEGLQDVKSVQLGTFIRYSYRMYFPWVRFESKWVQLE